MKRIIIDDNLSKNDRQMKAVEMIIPALSRVAWLWEKPIMVRELKNDLSESSADTSLVYVNLYFGHSIRGASSDSIQSIFGFQPKDNIRSKGMILKYQPEFSSSQYPYMYSYQKSLVESGFRQFFSPEGHCIARINGRSINILVDFSIFTPENSRDILEIVLMFAMPVILPEAMQEMRGIASRMLLGSKQFRINDKEKRMKRMLESINQYVSGDMKKSMAEMQARSTALNSRMAEIEKQRIENLVKISQLESAINSLEEKIRRDCDYSLKFDQLLKIKGVRGIQIEGESLVIYTDVIDMPKDGKLYNIGAYRIIFTPTPNQGHQAIRFQRYVDGEYCHQHINDDSIICFGGGDNGLNMALDKLMADFDIVPAAHLVMSFLRFEDNEPRGNKNLVKNKKEFPILIPEKNYGERKLKFCEFMRMALLKILKAPMSASLVAYRKAESDMANSYFLVRVEFQALIVQMDDLRARMTDRLLKETEISLLELENHANCQCVFFRKGLRMVINDLDINWPILVWIESGRLPWVITLDSQSRGIDSFSHSFSSTDVSNSFLKLVSQRNLPAVGLQVIKEIFVDKQGWLKRLLP